MRKRRWIIGALVLAMVVIAVLALHVMTQGFTPPIPPSPVAAFTTVDTSTDSVVNLSLAISSATDSSSISAYLSVNGTSSWAHATLTSSGTVLTLADGREFTVIHVDQDADGMVESGDHITIAGPFDGQEYRISLLFEPGCMTICEVTAQVN